MTQKRIYPVGIQDFEKLIDAGCVYVDKTELVYDLSRNFYIFLSRPRRFGKSLLSSTLKYYFQGRKDLFKGLAIERLEKEWRSYPVLHFDFSTLKNVEPEFVYGKLVNKLEEYEALYGLDGQGKTPGDRFQDLIRRAHVRSGEKAVIIIDEYDAPLLDMLHEQDKLDKVRIMMQEFYAPLKASDADIRFAFITGITKFSQLSVFSVINNLTNISMQPEYAAICGITEAELHTVFDPDIQMLADKYECSAEEMKLRLKSLYDGYHFSRELEDVYNPYSVLKAFNQKELASYWFESATPSYLIHQMRRFKTDVTALDDIVAGASDFDRPTEALSNAIPLLYQSGYLTIKGYERDAQMYHLAIPNKEVRAGLVENLIPLYMPQDIYEVRGFIYRFCNAMRNEAIEEALVSLRAYMAGIPYPEGGKAILQDMEKNEYYYETIFYLMFSFMSNYVQTQVKTCRGRADMVMFTPTTIYVFELKINKSAQEALAQIDEKGYMIPFSADGRKLVKCGVNFSTETRTIEEWAIKEE
ncbi:MAG: ATP-binding protein [Parabacteroides sp.]|nr:ATP-binding protein [Parabacteroides sp.]